MRFINLKRTAHEVALHATLSSNESYNKKFKLWSNFLKHRWVRTLIKIRSLPLLKWKGSRIHQTIWNYQLSKSSRICWTTFGPLTLNDMKLNHDKLSIIVHKRKKFENHWLDLLAVVKKSEIRFSLDEFIRQDRKKKIFFLILMKASIH